MRVFVTGVGRCGSVSFREACRRMTNYTTGHESLCGLLEYPDNHVEVNCHLRCCIVHLARKYPTAKWVHLIRQPDGCINSLAALDGGDVMRAYARLHPSVMPAANPGDFAWRYYWAETDSIKAQLKYVDANCMEVKLEQVKRQWHAFWQWVKAEGDYAASLKSWDTRYNTREDRNEVR